MSQQQSPPVKIGDIIRVGDEHYRYGVGPLILRVIEIGEVQQLDDGPWLNLRGVQVRYDGGDGDERQALVRVAALPIAARRPEES
jgi:hypothetical protein